MSGSSQTGYPVATNGMRDAGTLHRSAVAAADKLAAMGALSLSAGANGGSLGNGVVSYISVSPYNRWGNGAAAATVNRTTGAEQSTRVTFAQVTGADGYDIFSNAAATPPLWVARVTEAQRATGALVSAVGTVGAGGAAGAIDVNVVGTGLASNVLPFIINNAYTPATPSPVNCEGYSEAHLHVALAVTDLRSLPKLTLIPYFQDRLSPTDWFAGAPIGVNLLVAPGQPLEQDILLEVDGSTNMVILVDQISGQGAAASIWVELA